MRIGYTIWSKRHGEMFHQYVSKAFKSGMSFITVVFPFGYNVQTNKFTDPPSNMIAIEKSIEVVRSLSEKGIDWVFKLQVHPVNLPTGINPCWWPGYLTSSTFARWYPSFVASFYKWLIHSFKLRHPWMIVPGVELAGIVNKVNWPKLVRDLKKISPRSIVVYGANTWQPIRWNFSFLLWLARLFRQDVAVLNQIMRYSPFKVEQRYRRWLADLLYNAILPIGFFKTFGCAGLSCYWWPSMMGEDSIATYDKFEFDYQLWHWTIHAEFSYPEVVDRWRKGYDLHITETGVLSSSPFNLDREFVTKWVEATLDRFGFAESICFWDETKYPFIFDAVKAYLHG